MFLEGMFSGYWMMAVFPDSISGGLRRRLHYHHDIGVYDLSLAVIAISPELISLLRLPAGST